MQLLHLFLALSKATLDNDNDKDHSSSELSVHKALTCPGGQSAWAFAHFLFAEKFASCRNNLSGYTCADLATLEMKRACSCAGQGKCGSLTVKSVAGALFAAV